MPVWFRPFKISSQQFLVFCRIFYWIGYRYFLLHTFMYLNCENCANDPSKCIDDFEFGAFKLINVGTASLFLLTNLDSKGEVPDYLHVINNNRELRSMRDMLMSRWDGTKNLLQASCLHSDGWNFKNYCCCCTRRRLILCYLLLFTLK